MDAHKTKWKRRWPPRDNCWSSGLVPSGSTRCVHPVFSNTIIFIAQLWPPEHWQWLDSLSRSWPIGRDLTATFRPFQVERTNIVDRSGGGRSWPIGRGFFSLCRASPTQWGGDEGPKRPTLLYPSLQKDVELSKNTWSPHTLEKTHPPLSEMIPFPGHFHGSRSELLP